MQRTIHGVVQTLLLAASVSATARAQGAPKVSEPAPEQQAPSSGTPTRYVVGASVVAAALTAEGLATSAEHLRLALPLSSTTPAPELHIAAAEARPDGSLRLRLTCSNSTECLPFFASVEGADNAAFLARFAAVTHRQASPPHLPGVAVGAHVTLELADAQMRIHLPAVAIDTGSPGAEVRVASLDHKHTWRGIVVDAATVKGGVE